MQQKQIQELINTYDALTDSIEASQKSIEILQGQAQEIAKTLRKELGEVFYEEWQEEIYRFQIETDLHGSLELTGHKIILASKVAA